jgi:hypothetical protein
MASSLLIDHHVFSALLLLSIILEQASHLITGAERFMLRVWLINYIYASYMNICNRRS